MPKVTLGENLSLEWRRDPLAPELWDALQLIKSDSLAGLNGLKRATEAGSSLAMMYLGNTYLKGRHGIPKNEDLGEHWLRHSARAGSIEGAYGLAWHLLKSGRTDEALKEYEYLADLRYSPALFALGWQYYKGEKLDRDIKKSLEYFALAEKEGHLHAANWRSRIIMQQGGEIFSWTKNLVKRVALFLPFMQTALSNPHSDRLRT